VIGSFAQDLQKKMLCYSTIQRKRCAEMRKSCTWSGSLPIGQKTAE